MPSKFVIFNVFTLILQYSILCFLYYFLFKVFRIMYQDVKQLYITPNTRKSGLEAAKTMAKLIVINNTPYHSLQACYLLKELTSMGRSERSDIFIDETFVSNEHAYIENYKDDYWLTDLNSTNGTYVNEKKVNQKVLLQHNDTIKVGSALFRFER